MNNDITAYNEDFEDESKSYHVPMFPSHLGMHKPIRSLGIFEKGKIYLRSKLHPPQKVETYEEIVHVVFTLNLMLFTDSIASFPFLKEAVEDSQAKVICSKEGKPLAIRIKRKNRTRWIVRIEVWELPCCIASLDVLSDFYAFMDVGVHATPGGIGRALMRETWRKNNLPLHTTLNGYADNFFKEHTPGGRADTPGLSNFYPVTLELDMFSAYLKYYEKHPTGTASYFKYGYTNGYETYFARCTARIAKDCSLALGLFPIREQDREWKSLLRYPVEEGKYETYLWKEQIEENEKRGVDIEVHNGYGFFSMTEDNAYWCKYMYWLKQNALSDEIERMVKKCIVAPIGGHAMNNTFYTLVDESQYKEGDIPLAENGKFYAYFVHAERDFSSANMVHWWGYTLGMANLALLQFAYPFASDNRLICTNYDSVMVVPDASDYTRYPNKKEGKYNPVGTWGWTELHNVTITASRSYTSDEKIVQPGVQK